MKKPSGKRPAMFYQDGDIRGNEISMNAPRIRIVYPDGLVEWCNLYQHEEIWHPPVQMFNNIPCYIYSRGLKKAKNFKAAIKLINTYDIECGFKPMEFLGEL